MITWLDLLIGLLPFALVALLIWMRLRAAEVPIETALKFIAKVFVLVVMAIVGLMCITKGWRGGNSWMLAAGVIVTAISVFVLRWNLQGMVDKFPLPSNGSNQNGESNH